MESINVRDCLGTVETKPKKPLMIKKREWSADLAFERLKTVRKVQETLREGINKNSIEIPPMVADEYEQVWEKLKMLEYMEAETVRWGR